MRLPGLKTVVQAGRWLRSRFALGGLILGYHRVTEASAGPYGLSVSPKHFAEHLEVIVRQCRPVSLGQFVNGLAAGDLPRRAVAVTFDDGYADVLDHARPWLERHAIPATVFVITGALGHRLWWDDLAHLLLSAPRMTGSLRLNIAGERWELNDSGSSPEVRLEHRRRFVSQLHRRLLPLAPSQRDRILSHLRHWAGDPPFPAGDRCLTAGEVQHLAGDLVDIGAHTVNHPPLARQPLATQRTEIHDSKRALEALLGRPVTAFSYPNGSAGPSTRTLVQEAGFQFACGSQVDVARPGSHRFQLPRFWVPDCDGDAFARWLRPWLRA